MFFFVEGGGGSPGPGSLSSVQRLQCSVVMKVPRSGESPTCPPAWRSESYNFIFISRFGSVEWTRANHHFDGGLRPAIERILM